MRAKQPNVIPVGSEPLVGSARRSWWEQPTNTWGGAHQRSRPPEDVISSTRTTRGGGPLGEGVESDAIRYAAEDSQPDASLDSDVGSDTDLAGPDPKSYGLAEPSQELIDRLAVAVSAHVKTSIPEGDCGSLDMTLLARSPVPPAGLGNSTRATVSRSPRAYLQKNPGNSGKMPPSYPSMATAALLCDEAPPTPRSLPWICCQDTSYRPSPSIHTHSAALGVSSSPRCSSPKAPEGDAEPLVEIPLGSPLVAPGLLKADPTGLRIEGIDPSFYRRSPWEARPQQPFNDGHHPGRDIGVGRRPESRPLPLGYIHSHCLWMISPPTAVLQRFEFVFNDVLVVGLASDKSIHMRNPYPP